MTQSMTFDLPERPVKPRIVSFRGRDYRVYPNQVVTVLMPAYGGEPAYWMRIPRESARAMQVIAEADGVWLDPELPVRVAVLRGYANA